MRKLFAFLMFLSFASFASASSQVFPYMGADAMWRRMEFKSGFGKNLFKENVPQGNIYVGVQLTDYLALESGYEAIRKKKKTVNLVDGRGLGYIDPPVGEVHTYKEELKGWHSNVIVTVPCFLFYDPSLQFFGSIGVSYKKIRLVDTTLSDDAGAFSQELIDASRRTLMKKKAFLRLSAGLQKLLTDYIGVRVVVNWENTARFGSLKSQEKPAGETMAKPKNALAAGVGVFVKF